MDWWTKLTNRVFTPTDNAGNEEKVQHELFHAMTANNAKLKSWIDANRKIEKCFADMSDSPKQRKERPLKADGHAGRIALKLLHGNRMSVRDAFVLLDWKTTDAGRRMREARFYLEKQGFEFVEKDHERDGVRWKSWRIIASPDQLAAIRKIKEGK